MKKTITSRCVRLDLTDLTDRSRVFRVVTEPVDTPAYRSYLLLKPSRTMNFKVLIDWVAGARYSERFDLKQFSHLITSDPIVSLSPWSKSYIRLSHECLHRLFLEQDLSGDDNNINGYWIATTKSGKQYQLHFDYLGRVSSFVSHVIVKETPTATSDIAEPETKPQVTLAAPPVIMKKKRRRPCKSVFAKPIALTRDPNVSIKKRGRPRKEPV